MHKEIEEARAWSNARPSEFAVHDFKRWCLKGTIHARRLLFLYDRMQMEEDKRTIKELQAKLKAWEDAPTVSVYVEQDKNDIPRLYIEDCSDSADYGTYHLKPAEADDAQGD